MQAVLGAVMQTGVCIPELLQMMLVYAYGSVYKASVGPGSQLTMRKIGLANFRRFRGRRYSKKMLKE